MIRFLSSTILVILISGMFVQNVSAQTVDELAAKYVNLPQVQKLMNDMFSPEAMALQFGTNLPPTVKLADDKLLKIGTAMSTEMEKLRPRLKDVMIEGSAKTFNKEELDALIEFYNSEHGASVMAKMPSFFRNFMANMAPEINGIMQNLSLIHI